MVNTPDKKDLIISSLVNQRNNALNALSDCEANVILCQQENDQLKARIAELESVKVNIDEVNQ